MKASYEVELEIGINKNGFKEILSAKYDPRLIIVKRLNKSEQGVCVA